MLHLLNFAIVLLIGAVLTASGLPMDSAPVKTDMPEGVQRSKRLSSDDGAQALIAGLTYTRGILVSCITPTILPEVSGISKVDCTGVVSSVYKSLIAALDKLLRLYDLQEKFLDSDTSNSSVEMRALQIVIDTLVNQTCNWVRLN